MGAAVERIEPGALLNIGQVLDLLRAEFDDISISKIRLWEERGLVRPERTPAGYRKFSRADVERLRRGLQWQRDHYLPLEVIRDRLDAVDEGRELPAPDPVVPSVPKVQMGADGMPSPESYRRTDAFRLSRKELVKIAGITEDLLAELEEFALVTPSATGHFDTDALLIAQTAHELAEYGIQPRHLRAFRAAADREIGLVEQIVAPVRQGRDPAARARADEAASEIAALSVRLHATLVKAGLRRL